MTNITKAAQTSTEPWSFWEALPGHLIDKYEGATLTEELLQEAAASLHAKLRAEQPASHEPCSGPLCGLPEFGEHHPLCKLHLRAALQDKAGEVREPTLWISQKDLDRLKVTTVFRPLVSTFKPLNDGEIPLFAAQPAPVVPDDVVRYRTIRGGLVYIEPHESGEIYVAGETGVYTKSGDEFDAAIDAIAASQKKG